jgi:hypothetical protein
MKRFTTLALAGLVLAVSACDDDPLASGTPDAPAPPTTGIQAFIQVDNEDARPGDAVRVYVRVQFGTETNAKLGSYTGRLRFSADQLGWREDVPIDDGLRVTNPNGAPQGEIRFAGASAGGFGELTLYQGAFEVRKTGWLEGLAIVMEELSAAETLGNLQPDLQVAPRVFLRSSAR